MDFPLVFRIGSLAVSAHLVFELLAFFIGFRYFLYLRRRQADPISSPNRLWILIGAATGALLFSRLLGALEDPRLFLSGEAGYLYYYQSKTIVGGLLGGLLGVELAKKAIGEQQSSGDLFTYPLMLAMIIGRVGCFFAGVSEPTYGNPTALPWGVDLGDGLYRHPTALYEIMYLVLLWLGIFLLEKNVPLKNGSRFKLFLAGYLLYRFMIDFIRPGFRFEIGLTTLQLASLIGLIYYYKVFLFPGQLGELGSGELGSESVGE